MIEGHKGNLMAGEARRKEIREVHMKHRFFYELLGGAVLLLIGILIGAVFLDVDILGDDSIDYRMNLVTEGMGIVATVFIINRWYAHRESKKDTRSLKQKLVENAGSSVNEIARHAIEQLRHNGWLEGNEGLLQGEKEVLNHANWNNACLDRANLQNTSLVGAELNSAEMIKTELQNATLSFAKMHSIFSVGAYFQDSTLSNAELTEATLANAQLQRAKLIKAKLEEVYMPSVNLQGADLAEANMKKARLLWDVNLKGTNLRDTDLEGAIILGANLRGANLCGSNIHEAYLNEIILPNGGPYTNDSDLDKFTNAEHKEFAETLKEINGIRKRLGYREIIPS